MQKMAEILARETGVWCPQCLLPSIIVHHVVLRTYVGLEMCSRARCESCGRFFQCPPAVRP